MWRRSGRIILVLALLIALCAQSVNLPGIGHLLGARAAGTLTLSKSTGVPSTVVAVTAPNDTFTASTQVSMTFKDSANTLTTLEVVSSDANGAISTNIVIPVGAATGVGLIIATQNSDNTKTAVANFTVTAIVQPTNIIVVPSYAVAGENVQVMGSGFTPNGGFTVTISGLTANFVSGASATADSTGNISTVVTVPNVTTGTQQVVVRDSASGLTGSTSNFYVTSGAAPTGPITVAGLTLQASVNTALSNVTLGSFTDSAGLTASDYTIAINWGDGTAISSAAHPSRSAGTTTVHPAGVSEQYTITGSHIYTASGTFAINVTISASDGRTAYLTSIAQVGTGTSATSYQLAAGWNLLSPQLVPGAALQASTVLSTILSTSGGRLTAIYGLSSGQWTPSRIQRAGSQPIGADFALARGQGYLVYTDAPATITLNANGQPSALRPGVQPAIRTALTSQQRTQLPPLPAVP
jgi:hypothetical protein